MPNTLSQGMCISKAVFAKFLYLLKNSKSLIVFQCIEAWHNNSRPTHLADNRPRFDTASVSWHYAKAQPWLKVAWSSKYGHQRPLRALYVSKYFTLWQHYFKVTHDKCQICSVLSLMWRVTVQSVIIPWYSHTYNHQMNGLSILWPEKVTRTC